MPAAIGNEGGSGSGSGPGAVDAAAATLSIHGTSTDGSTGTMQLPSTTLLATPQYMQPEGTPVMADEEYALLNEILDRAQSILRTCPPSDGRSLSFLRLLAAYDQVLQRHDLTPASDTNVFQWLVTMNIQTEEKEKEEEQRAKEEAEAEQKEGQPVRTGGRAREYGSWKRKLQTLYDAGAPQRWLQKQGQQQQQMLQSQQPSQIHGVPLELNQKLSFDRPPGPELSIDSLASSLASAASPQRLSAASAGPDVARFGASRVTFASPLESGPGPRAGLSIHTHHGDVVSSGSRGRHRPQLSDDSPGRVESVVHIRQSSIASDGSEGRPMDAASTAVQTSVAALRTVPVPIPVDYDDGDTAAAEFASFLDPHRSRIAFAAPELQTLVRDAFVAWYEYARPHQQVFDVLTARRQVRLILLRNQCYHVWRGSFVRKRFERYLDDLLHQYQLRLQHNLFHCWRGSYMQMVRYRVRLQRWRRKHALHQWVEWTRHKRVQKRLQFLAVRFERRNRRKHAIEQWRKTCDLHRVESTHQRTVVIRIHERMLHESFQRWRESFRKLREYVFDADATLFQLRVKQCLRVWRRFAASRQLPSYRSRLPIQQFHMLWRWISRSFGAGYDLFRIVWLASIRYQPAQETARGGVHHADHTAPSEEHRADDPTTAVPSHATHPFVAGPPIAAFAATVAAPFTQTDDRSDILDSFSYSLPTDSFTLGASSSATSSSASPGALASSSSHPVFAPSSSSSGMVAAVPPHPIDPSLPMHHALLSLLNRRLSFRRHRLPPLIRMCMLWATWYRSHLFRTWRNNVIKKVRRKNAQQKKQAEMQARQRQQDEEADGWYEQRLLVRSFDQWVDAFHRSSYYCLLLHRFNSHHHARLIRDSYTQWKWLFVSMRAHRLFSIRRGVSHWKRFLKRRRDQQRKQSLVEFAHGRRTMQSMWDTWRVATRRKRETTLGLTQVIWNRWKEAFAARRAHRTECHDADVYYSLKLLLRSLLTWRAAALTQTLDAKYITKAVHHRHAHLAHRHIVWWVNWTRYQKDSRRMMEYGEQVFDVKLKRAAINLWRMNSEARSHRHRMFFTCRTGVRNKWLAHAVLVSWRYALACRLRANTIAAHVALNHQRRCWQMWHSCIRLKNAQYESLEQHVAQRRDHNHLASIFYSWYETRIEVARAKRLRAHIEIVWYYALVKRMFRSWHLVATDIHQAQMEHAAIVYKRNWQNRMRRVAIHRWHGILKHRAQYRSIISNTHRRLLRRHELPTWFSHWKTAFQRSRNCRIFLRTKHRAIVLRQLWQRWRKQLAEEQEQQAKLHLVCQQHASSTLRRCFKRWYTTFVPFSQRRREMLGNVMTKVEMSQLKVAMHEWKEFHHESKLQKHAIAFDRKMKINKFLHTWRQAFQQMQHEHHDLECAHSLFCRKVLAEVLDEWKVSVRGRQIHRFLLCKKTLAGWKHVTSHERDQKKLARAFKDQSADRRLKYMVGRWRKLVRYTIKQRRRLMEARVTSVDADLKERIASWAKWSHVRTTTRKQYARLALSMAVRLGKRYFAHWHSLYQQSAVSRVLNNTAVEAHRRRAVLYAIHLWRRRAIKGSKVRLAEAQIDHLSSHRRLHAAWCAWRAAQSSKGLMLQRLCVTMHKRRLQRLFMRWHQHAGRKGQILRIHRSLLHSVLHRWHDEARSSKCDREWVPQADAMAHRLLRRHAWGVWRWYQPLHHAFTRTRACTIRTMKRDAFHSWMAMFHVSQRRAYVASLVQSLHTKTQLQMAYRSWRFQSINRIQMAQRSEAFCRHRSYRRIMLQAYKQWRMVFAERMYEHRIQERGESFEWNATNRRKKHHALWKWMRRSAYHTHITNARQHLSSSVFARRLSHAFFIWHALFSRVVAVRRMDRFIAHRTCRASLYSWLGEVQLMKHFEAIRESNRMYCMKRFLGGWWRRMKRKQKDRADVASLQSRIDHLVHMHGVDQWDRTKQIIVPAFKSFLGAGSCLRFYLRLWSRYAKHCRSFIEANDCAATYYDRRILLPSTWHSWRLAMLQLAQSRHADAFRLNHAKRRFLRGLRSMLVRRAMETRERAVADRHARRIRLRHAFVEWINLAMQIQAERDEWSHRVQTECFHFWRNKMYTRKKCEECEFMADTFNRRRLIQRLHHHWKTVWIHTLSLEHRSHVFRLKLTAWHVARVFAHWLSRYRQKIWRRTRTKMILQAVQLIWQKNAFHAWNGYVRVQRERRRRFIMARTMYAWRVMARRKRERVIMEAEDKRIMQDMEEQRLMGMQRIGGAAAVPSIPHLPPAFPPSPPPRSPRRPPVTFAASASSIGAPLSFADLEDHPSIPASSFQPSPLSVSSPIRLSSSHPAASSSSTSSSTGEQWRLTPIRTEHSAAHAHHPPQAMASSSTNIGVDLTTRLPPVPPASAFAPAASAPMPLPVASDTARLSTAQSASSSPNHSPQRSSTRRQRAPSPEVRAQSDAAAALRRSRRRQDRLADERRERDREDEPKERVQYSPATSAFVAKLFVD